MTTEGAGFGFAVQDFMGGIIVRVIGAWVKFAFVRFDIMNLP